MSPCVWISRVLQCYCQKGDDMRGLSQVRLHRGHRAAQRVGAPAEAPPAEGTRRGGPISAGVHAEGRNLAHRQQKKIIFTKHCGEKS